MSLETELKAVSISELQSGPFLAMEADAPLRSVLERMRTETFEVALLTSEDKPVGLISGRVVLADILGNTSVVEKAAAEVAEPAPPSLAVGAPISSLIRDLTEHPFVCTVDEAGKVVALISRARMLRFLSDRFNTTPFNRSPGQDPAARPAAATR